MFIISKVTSEVFFLHTPLKPWVIEWGLVFNHYPLTILIINAIAVKIFIVSKSTSNNCLFWVMLISGKQILHTSELFAMRSKSLKRMNGFFVSNYDWEVSFKLSLSVIFPMTPTHRSIWSYFFNHNDIDKILPKAQRPKQPMFRVGNQIWLRTPACLAA